MHKRQEFDPSTVGLHDSCFRNRLAMWRRVVGPFAMHVGPQSLQCSFGRVFIENHDVIDAREPGKKLRPLRRSENWPLRTLQLAYRLIAIETNDQNVAETLGCLQASQVADMQDVETAIGPDYYSAI